MEVFATKREVRLAVARDRRAGRTVGFVPTMGALHDGHLSLVWRAQVENERTLVSIFVNPLQFGPAEDFRRYPRDLERDLKLAEGAGADYVFAPPVEEMYPAGEPATRVEVGRIGEVAEGRFRPGHFSGVATVCVKLFSIAGADRVYFGRKDAQQLAVIRRVVRDLDIPLEVVACPTVREPDGLAMSSRNAYLDPEAREAAVALSRGLFSARELAAAGIAEAAALRSRVEEVVASEPGVRLQYADVFDPDAFEPLESVEGGAVIALAAVVGGTRLIDNVEVTIE